jgi:Fe-S-cluster containining protein
MNADLKPISLNDRLSFGCCDSVACFNECCRDLNQFLTPYDILRLKNHLGMSAGDFLTRYCSRHTGPETGLPIITLMPKEMKQLTCPFVTTAGCSVYPDRPSSCRTYPLVRTISKSRQTGAVSEHFMVLNEPHCLGFQEKKEQTVRQWIANQGLGVYNEFNDMLMEIISLKYSKIPGPLDIKSQHIFHLALYDLDGFRSQIFSNSLLKDYNADQKLRNDAATSDEALLKLGLAWVKRQLFPDAQ